MMISYMDFTGARDHGVAVASAGPYANHLPLFQTDNHATTSPLTFYRPDTLPAAQPTASKHWRHCSWMLLHRFISKQVFWYIWWSVVLASESCHKGCSTCPSRVWW